MKRDDIHYSLSLQITKIKLDVAPKRTKTIPVCVSLVTGMATAVFVFEDTCALNINS
jgi:hypothetical protein